MITITLSEEELDTIFEALNLAGSVKVNDYRFDFLFDELKERI